MKIKVAECRFGGSSDDLLVRNVVDGDPPKPFSEFGSVEKFCEGQIPENLQDMINLMLDYVKARRISPVRSAATTPPL
jgi:hypothetical protein